MPPNPHFKTDYYDTDCSTCSDGTSTSSELNLEEFIMTLPEKISHFDYNQVKNKAKNKEKEKEISSLFGRLVLDKEEWERFSYFDNAKNYTRNLVSTDGEYFTLLLLCWNPGKESPIHDHPCDGCWMHVCEGSVKEVQYAKDEGTDSLKCTADKVFTEGENAYIDDFIGYHKVGNPSSSQRAVTLHLYSPPIEKCNIWFDPSNASKPTKSCVCYHSEYGTPL
mmetsp:Transcript_9581/g.14027  ORF Transcript_9581/g.14027 Transcript_9581/m.14027 type:complete len:222 (+) Transcript_9581:75-740(+)|eukprot:CAMPEP_0195517312 /NCGR_PEP_ID=MMETSP0794_2-20130614/10303_1 /TAXON_ID=515487 /ORGANISM="Stephanopyxis turris, Strain CCMP 815" /LENGTH=221 /DNA_ID=CAMNT_0040646087 /DNA_START=71 /DNA_END=736 /DNA_ORIENTATION=+